MDKLELKHIAPYLPYGLKVQYEGILNGKELKEYDKSEPVLSDPYSEEYIEFWRNRREDIGLKISKIKEVKFYNNYIKFYVGRHHGYLKPLYLGDFKPILRPLTAYKDLFGKALIDLNCDLETQIQITEFANQDRSLNSISYDAYNELVKAKVDVFGLIEKGLAVDATKLEGGA